VSTPGSHYIITNLRQQLNEEALEFLKKQNYCTWNQNADEQPHHRQRERQGWKTAMLWDCFHSRLVI